MEKSVFERHCGYARGVKMAMFSESKTRFPKICVLMSYNGTELKKATCGKQQTILWQAIEQTSWVRNKLFYGKQQWTIKRQLWATMQFYSSQQRIVADNRRFATCHKFTIHAPNGSSIDFIPDFLGAYWPHTTRCVEIRGRLSDQMQWLSQCHQLTSKSTYTLTTEFIHYDNHNFKFQLLPFRFTATCTRE